MHVIPGLNDECGGATRREWLTRTGCGMAMCGLAGVLADDCFSATSSAAADPMAPKAPHFTPRAKRVIHFFMNGGPSHVDLFDPKPALAKYAGKPLPVSLRTERKTGAALPTEFKFSKHGESGLEISNAMPLTAKHADEVAIIRSMYAQVPNHEPSLLLMNCGDSVQPRPSVGSWVTYGLGTENRNLPGFIAMCPDGYPISDTANWQSGFLPGIYQGTFIDSRHKEIDKLIENIHSQHATSDIQRRQLALLRQMNAAHQQQRETSRLDARIQSFELAFRMQMEAAEAFDISAEPAYIKALYGDGVHGRQTLIARRLLERGVRYIQLWHGAGQPWDSHNEITKNTAKLSAELDRPIAALLTDLKLRGMLDDTLVIWGGEFGRTPAVEAGLTGRDHNHYGFSVCLAGGGVRGGVAYGATDEFGFQAVEKPTSVHDLHATILHVLGFDHERLTYRYAGRDFRLTDVHGHVVHEILI